MIRILLLVLLYMPVQARVYYVDVQKGQDENVGTSEAKAWKSLKRVDEHIFSAGDTLLFKAGQTWSGQVWLKGSGQAHLPIVVGKFGQGKRPRLDGGGASYTLKVYNSSYWEIQDLEITNYSAQEEGGLSLDAWERGNRELYAEPRLPQKAHRDLKMKVGVLIAARDAGKIKHLYLRNLEVHGVNGNIVPDGKDENGASKHNGGIAFQIDGNRMPTWWEDVRIENCLIRDVDRTGLFFKSTWDSRTAEDPGNWTPSTGIHIRHSIFRRTGANALIVRVASDPVVEYNLFDYCAIKGSGNAAFSFNTDGAVWQFNECRFTKANAGDNDAGGLDSDYRSKRTVLQYNYLHHNDFGLLVTGGGGSFNEGTVVRYNLVQADGKEMHQEDKRKFALKVSGGARDTHIYGNSIEIAHDSVQVIFHKRWKVWPQVTAYHKNYLSPYRGQMLISLGESSGNTFGKNYVRGNHVHERFTMLHEAEYDKSNPASVRNLKRIKIGPVSQHRDEQQEDLLYLELLPQN